MKTPVSVDLVSHPGLLFLVPGYEVSIICRFWEYIMTLSADKLN